jgi:REP element-mobilizing transposase RayT
MARGDRREAIFHDDEDRRMFLAVLEEACGRTGWLCHAYVLMPNHYHLVIETPEPNLVEEWYEWCTAYSRRFSFTTPSGSASTIAAAAANTSHQSKHASRWAERTN